MMDSVNTQRDERLSITAKVKAFNDHGLATSTGVTANVSESGLFAILEPAPVVGSVFPLEVKLRRRQIRALARVVWRREAEGPERQAAGVGVEFVAVRDLSGLKKDLDWYRSRM
jgi:hypothetical protein